MFRLMAIASCAIALVGPAALVAASAQVSDSCPTGFVRREAYPGDHLCVAPEFRAQARTAQRGCTPGRAPPDNGECQMVQAPAAEPTPSQPPVVPTARSNVTIDPFLGVTAPRPFLIIAPDEFMAALEPLVAHKNSTGMPTLAVSIAQLTSRFAGADDPEKIKRGIQYATEHLGTQYVMLVGDPHWFPVRFIFFKNFSRSYPNHPNERNLPVDGVYAPSDLYYANLYHHRVVRAPDIKVLPGARFGAISLLYKSP